MVFFTGKSNHSGFACAFHWALASFCTWIIRIYHCQRGWVIKNPKKRGWVIINIINNIVLVVAPAAPGFYQLREVHTVYTYLVSPGSFNTPNLFFLMQMSIWFFPIKHNPILVWFGSSLLWVFFDLRRKLQSLDSCCSQLFWYLSAFVFVWHCCLSFLKRWDTL